MLIRINQYLNFLFRFSIEGRMSPGFRLELSTSLLVFVDDIFRRIAASNSCSNPCGLSMVLGGGVNISSGTGVLCCSPWKKIWITINDFPYGWCYYVMRSAEGISCIFLPFLLHLFHYFYFVHHPCFWFLLLHLALRCLAL